MSVSFHVNGLAGIYIGPPGGTSIALGYSTDGVTIDLDFKTENVMTDMFGSQIPEDILNMGQEARVTTELVKYDIDTLEQVQDRFRNYNTSDPGYPPNLTTSGAGYANLAIGALLKQCGNSYALTIASGNTCTEGSGPKEGGYTFNCAFLDGVDSFKVGTRVTRHTLTWRCIPDASGILYHKI